MTVLTSSQLLVTVKDDVTVERPKSSVHSIVCLHWKTILAEFLSTAFLLFFGCMTCVPLEGNHLIQPLYSSFGFGLIVLFNIQAFGHISGAHMNPCITLIAILWKKIPLTLGLFYIIAQCVGAITGYGILIGITPTDLKIPATCLTQPHEKYTELQALIIELFLTMALSVLTCATWDPLNKDGKESNSLKFGLAVAGGASMNPARSLGPAVWVKIWNGHWIYWVGPILGSNLTAVFYKKIWLGMDNIHEIDTKSLIGDKRRDCEF